MPGLKLLPPWTGSGAVTSHFEGMEVELKAMQAARAHPGGHPTQGAASPQFGGRIPRQELSPLPPSAGTGRGEQEHQLLPSQSPRAEIALSSTAPPWWFPQQLQPDSLAISMGYTKALQSRQPNTIKQIIYNALS